MFNNNFIPENFEGNDQNFISNDFAGYMLPGLDAFGGDMFQKDFQNFPMPDFEGFDPTSFMQYFDQALQSMPDEIKQFIQLPLDCVLSATEGVESHLMHSVPKPSFAYSKAKIGTLSPEERRLKVQRFLEKRKRRNFKKKISYMCRKKVADKRVRVKGRFVSKVQASALLESKPEEEDINKALE